MVLFSAGGDRSRSRGTSAMFALAAAGVVISLSYLGFLSLLMAITPEHEQP